MFAPWTVKDRPLERNPHVHTTILDTLLIDTSAALRSLASSYDTKPPTPTSMFVHARTDATLSVITSSLPTVLALAGKNFVSSPAPGPAASSTASTVTVELLPPASPPPWACALQTISSSATAYLALADRVRTAADVARERARTADCLARATDAVARLEKAHDEPGYADRVPQAVRNSEAERLDMARREVFDLRECLITFDALQIRLAAGDEAAR